MKSFKPVLFVLVVIALVVLVVQNLEVFMHEESLKLNILVWSDQTRPVPLSVYFLGFFLAGLLISYFYGLSERFKAKKTLNNHMETIHKLQEEVKVLKSLPVEEQPTPPEESESS